MTTPKLAGCLYCIEGFEPSSVHLYLGPVYMACRTCTDNGDLDQCPSCNGDALFPANFDRIHQLAAYLAQYGLCAVLCIGCFGVIDFRALATGGTS